MNFKYETNRANLPEWCGKNLLLGRNVKGCKNQVLGMVKDEKLTPVRSRKCHNVMGKNKAKVRKFGVK